MRSETDEPGFVMRLYLKMRSRESDGNGAYRTETEYNNQGL